MVERGAAWRCLPPVPPAVFESVAVRDASLDPAPAPNEPLPRVAHGEQSDPVKALASIVNKLNHAGRRANADKRAIHYPRHSADEGAVD